MADLDQVEPAVIEAQQGSKIIKTLLMLDIFEALAVHRHSVVVVTDASDEFFPYILIILTLAVKSIKKQHLVEVRSMANPPFAVKMALEAICLMLGEAANDWKAIRSVIIRDNFINTIVNFSTDDIRYPVIIILYVV